MLKRLLMIVVASGLAARGLDALLRRAEATKQRDRKLAVQRWEDEGGRVPETVRATP